MRFLENLVSGMIRDSTGIDARRLVRRIGGRNILLAGGAALAGALAASQLGRQGGSPQPAAPGTSAAAPLPPLPTPGGSAAAPPLPPLPVPTAAESPSRPEAAASEGDAPELPPALLFAVVRTMAAAALADGEMAPEERAAIEGHLGESGLSEDQIRRIRKDLVLPPTPRELAAQLPEGWGVEAAETLYRCAAAVLRADLEVSERERDWLESLAAALALPPERTAELTAEVFR